jgi:hypothetical protein
LGTRDADGNLWVARSIPGENNEAIITHPWCRLSADGPAEAQSQIDSAMLSVIFHENSVAARNKEAGKRVFRKKSQLRGTAQFGRPREKPWRTGCAFLPL